MQLARMERVRGMATFGVFEAKSSLSDLIARAEKGEDVVITRNGRPVVRLQPIEDERRLKAIAAAERMIAALEAQRGELENGPDPDEVWEDIKRDRDERLDKWS